MRTSLIAILLIFTIAAPALGSDVTGNWNLTFQGPMGPETWKLTLNADGTVNGEHPFMGPIKGKNNCAGEKWDLFFKLPTPMGEMEFNFLGKISGATANGTINMMERTQEWNAVKK